MPTMPKRGASAAFVLSAFALAGCVAPNRPVPQAVVSPPATNAMKADSWVVGQIFNAENGKVISANLTLYFQEIEPKPRKPLRRKTNLDGKFEFGPVTSGLYCVLATSFGYQSVAREFTLHTGKRDTVNLELARQSVSLGGQVFIPAVQTSGKRCQPERSSIELCPDDAKDPREAPRTRCSGQP